MTRAQRQPVKPAGDIVSRHYTAQGLVEIDLGHRTNADKVAQQAQDFCELGLCVHGGIMRSVMMIFNLIEL
ncbi:TPA: hypothetical protein ACPZP6_003224 [Yersinia enterocolitica]|uniref:hypothetical protein n=1 Tax=Yersinia enterocolitica TaxID=630 RepID=UPI001F574F3C|nr:hypothetical protein [Yersinia enterocolitica]